VTGSAGVHPEEGADVAEGEPDGGVERGCTAPARGSPSTCRRRSRPRHRAPGGASIHRTDECPPANMGCHPTSQGKTVWRPSGGSRSAATPARDGRGPIRRHECLPTGSSDVGEIRVPSSLQGPQCRTPGAPSPPSSPSGTKP